jgi:transposase-like protein
MARAKQAKTIHQMTFREWETAFPDEDECCAYLVGHRWPAGVACPRCGNVKVKPHGKMAWHWLCNECSPSETNYRFSHITGTIFENTNKPLRDWFRVIHLMLTSKKGISALQIHRMMGFGSYRTAWYMCHRIRAALGNEEFRKLLGIGDVPRTGIGTSAAVAVELAASARARPLSSAQSAARAMSSLALSRTSALPLLLSLCVSPFPRR